MNDSNESMLHNSGFEESHSGDSNRDEVEIMRNPKETAVREINRLSLEECASDDKALDALAKIIEDINGNAILPEEGLKKAKEIANSLK